MQIQRMCTNYYVADYEVRYNVPIVVTNAEKQVESDITGDPASCSIAGSS